MLILLFVACFGSDNQDADLEPTDGETGRVVGFTAEHNAHRAEVDVPDLEWDNELADIAADWLAHLENDNGCNMEHDWASPLGENLAWNAGYEETPIGVTNGWMAEVKDYDYDSNSCSGPMCGHYTQVIWHSSERVGCAQRTCENGEELWMCNYDPPGNWQGEKPY